LKVSVRIDPNLQSFAGNTSVKYPQYPEASMFARAALTTSTIVFGIGAIALPALPLQSQLVTTNPRLGDTAAIQIQVDTPQSKPIVTLGDKTYPAFSIGPNRYRAFIPSTPLEKPGVRKVQVSADGKIQEVAVNFASRYFRIQRINLPPGKAGVEATEYELQKVGALKVLVTPIKYWNGAFLAPSKASTSTPFGVKRYYNGKFANDYYHRGLDYAGAEGSPVTAPAGGRVALVGLVKDGFRVHGNIIGVDHGQGVISIFMHLSRIDVAEGDMVQPGDVIGAIGTTGASTGAHLHWGLYVNAVGVEPAQWRKTAFE
jgi:murein DD-endopeptidase MepM/ murein hydrolase activator NlpD